jgi:hypothetical protein
MHYNIKVELQNAFLEHCLWTTYLVDNCGLGGFSIAGDRDRFTAMGATVPDLFPDVRESNQSAGTFQLTT